MTSKSNKQNTTINDDFKIKLKEPETISSTSTTMTSKSNKQYKNMRKEDLERLEYQRNRYLKAKGDAGLWDGEWRFDDKIRKMLDLIDERWIFQAYTDDFNIWDDSEFDERWNDAFNEHNPKIYDMIYNGGCGYSVEFLNHIDKTIREETEDIGCEAEFLMSKTWEEKMEYYVYCRSRQIINDGILEHGVNENPFNNIIINNIVENSKPRSLPYDANGRMPIVMTGGVNILGLLRHKEAEFDYRQHKFKSKEYKELRDELIKTLRMVLVFPKEYEGYDNDAKMLSDFHRAVEWWLHRDSSYTL